MKLRLNWVVIWPYIFLSFTSLFLFGLIDNSRGPIFPELIREFAITAGEASWFYAMTSIFSFIGSWACVHTLKKIDRVQNLYLAQLLLAIGLFGWSQSRNFAQLLGFSALTGLGFGLTAVSYNLLATVGAHPLHRQRVLSILHSMYGLSSFIAPLVVAVTYHWGFDWRRAFLFYGFLCLIFLFVSMFLLRKELVTPGSSTEVASSAPAPERSTKGIHIVGFSFACYVMAEILISSRLALFLRMDHGFDLEKSSFYVTGFFLCLLASRVVFSFVRTNWKVHSQLMACLALSFVMMLLGLLVHESFLMLTGLALGPFYALTIVYLAEAFPHHLNFAMSRSMSMQFFLTIAMHLGSGFLTDSMGIRQAMLLGPACLLLSLFLLWIFPRWNRH